MSKVKTRRKVRIISLAAAIVCMTGYVCVNAEQGGTLFTRGRNAKGFEREPYTVTRINMVGMATEKITIDGKAKEASWFHAVNYAKQLNNYIDSQDSNSPIKSQDGDGPGKYKGIQWKPGMAKVKVCKLLWNKTGLYCYMEVADKTKCLYKTGAVEINSDSIEYYIDAANKDRKSYGNDNNEEQYRLDRGGKQTPSGSHAETPGQKAFLIDSKSISTSDGYQQEILIRWDSHNLKKVKKGNKVGFDIQVNDAVDHVRKTQVIWNSWDEAWFNPSTMGTIRLGEKIVISKAQLKKVKPGKITAGTKKITGITTAGATVRLKAGKKVLRKVKLGKKKRKFTFRGLKLGKIKKGKRITLVTKKAGWKTNKMKWKMRG